MNLCNFSIPMKNELFQFWAGGWKAYAEEQKNHAKDVTPNTLFGRILKFSRSLFKPFDGSIDKRLF